MRFFSILATFVFALIFVNVAYPTFQSDRINSEPIILPIGNNRALSVNERGVNIGNFDDNSSAGPIVENSQLASQLSFSLPYDTLENIVGLIEADSIRSYTAALDAFLCRIIGSNEHELAIEWLMAKFKEYGYAPILDTCSYGSDPIIHNVMAYKQGISFPNKYIIIGAHYDAVWESPAASDNGAGVAGVLEIARILKDRNTHYTFVLALFDGEEEALIGSAFMADRFASNGDSIAIMLNMDEIGSMIDYYPTTVRLFYGPYQYPLAQRFSILAGTLPSIYLSSEFMGSTPLSDHYAFQSCGYNALFALANPQSPYRHTNRDSSIYVNYNYAARIVRGIMALALDIDDQYKPALGLVFNYPEGLPEYASAETETPFQVQVSGIAGGIPASGTGKFYYSTNGSTYDSISMTDMGGGLYNVSLPVLNCDGGEVRFFVGAEESGGSTFYDHGPSNPMIIPIAIKRVSAYTDNFEIDKGWSTLEGLWAIGSPAPGWLHEYGSPDPTGGRNSTNCLAYNLNGDYEHNLPTRRAISPSINCVGLSDVHLKFWRWLGIEAYGADYARIAVSTDGTNFTNVWSNYQQTAGGYWMEDEVDISSVADNQATVYVEFVMGPTDVDGSFCGWNVDDLEVYGYECKTWICGDANGDTKINLLDVSYIISSLYRGGPKPDPIQSADVNSDGKMNLLDVSYIINFLYRHGTAPNCP